MSEILIFFGKDLVALSVVQIVGILILVASLDNDDEIASRSGTYWNYNLPMLKHIVAQNYDQKLGVLTVVLPTILEALNDVPIHMIYICLLIALILRFSPIRKYRIKKRIEKIKQQLKDQKEQAKKG